MISELIVDHDRVGLPGVGTFYTEVVPSTFSDRGYTINPPYRRLSFLPNALENDLLVEFYARVNDIPEDVSREYLEQFLSEMAGVLKERKTIILPGLGRLRATKENNFFFVPDEDLDIYPEAFGLASVSLKSLPALDDDKVEIPFEFRARRHVAGTAGASESMAPSESESESSGSSGQKADPAADTEHTASAGTELTSRPGAAQVSEPAPSHDLGPLPSSASESEPAPAAEPASETGLEPNPEPQPDPESEPVSVSEPAPSHDLGPLPSSAPESEPAPAAEPASETGLEPEPESKSEPDPESKSKPEPDPDPESGTESEQDSDTDSGAEEEREPDSGPSTQPEPFPGLSADSGLRHAESQKTGIPKRFRWWIPLLALAALAAVALVAFLILAHVAPDFIDSILYTPEELRIINY